MKGNRDIYGVIVPVHTPFNKDQSIDFKGLGEIVRDLCDKGVHSLMIVGTCGEFSSLSVEERKKIAELVIDEVGDRVPIVVHVGHPQMPKTLELAEHAQKTGADSLMCLPPLLLGPTQEDIYSYFVEISKKIDISLMIYNNPGRTNITINTPTMIKLAQVDKIDYLKDSARNLRHTSDVIQGVGDSMVVLSGEADICLPILSLGAKGGLTVPSLVVPQKAIEMYDAFVKGDMAKAQKAHYEIMELVHALTSEGKNHPAMKAALRMQGRAGGYMRNPITDVSETCKARLREVLEKLGAL